MVSQARNSTESTGPASLLAPPDLLNCLFLLKFFCTRNPGGCVSWMRWCWGDPGRGRPQAYSAWCLFGLPFQSSREWKPTKVAPNWCPRAWWRGVTGAVAGFGLAPAASPQMTQETLRRAVGAGRAQGLAPGGKVYRKCSLSALTCRLLREPISLAAAPGHEHHSEAGGGHL